MSDCGEGRDAPLKARVLDRISDGVVGLDADLRYTFVNDTAADFLGVSREELLGTHLWEVFPDATGTTAQEKIREALDTRRQTSYERYNDQTDQWYNTRVYPDEDGVTLYFTTISEREEFEYEFDANRQLTELIRNTTEAIYVKDRDGHYRLMNEAAANLFGLDSEAVLGKHDEELFDAESTAGIRAVDEAVVEHGEPRTRESALYIDGERHVFLTNKYPYRDDDGNVVGVMGISRDITDRNHREQRLEELTEQYDALCENAQDGIFVVNVDTAGDETTFRFERLSPSTESMTGLHNDDVRGKTLREALGADIASTLRENYRRCVDAREPITFEETFSLPEGSMTLQTKLAPVVVDGDVTRIVGITRDTTTRVEREASLERRNERLDEFAAVISHDLRNPLSIAQGHSALLADDSDAGDVEQILAALERMDAIVQDTLTLARQGRTVADTEPVELRSLVHRYWRMVDTRAATVDVVDDVTVDGDPSRLGQALENLFRNAVEHAGDTATVRVGRATDAGFYVEDDGPGIPDDQRNQVFDAGHTSVADGTGFGLAIVERIADAHGWQVDVRDSESGGARFEFSDVDVVS
ncbi:PAS domain-containing protein [Halobacterium litoreum]|uniref:histidine kinase n=1 Tax=Halobacterium litoreum TaxID=2039234 RepID=A0ABD5NCV7_9EURY|nr:PAS domain-containing protein [Halobacterium litoreum]UHH14020.1 PAS domain-containing protein [Halobacterium litoreum]